MLIWGATGITRILRRSGRQDGAACCEGVGGAAGGGTDDKAVAGIGGEVAAIEIGADADYASEATTAENDIVEGVEGAANSWVAAVGAGFFHDRAYHEPLFDPVVAVEQFFQGGWPVLGKDFGQKAEPAHLYAEHGHVEGCAEAGGAQHRAVAAEGD